MTKDYQTLVNNALNFICDDTEDFIEDVEEYLREAGYDLEKTMPKFLERMKKALDNSPFNPKNNYEIALLYLDLGNTEKTIEYLEKAIEIWKDADSNYKSAQEAKAKLEEVKETIVL